MIKHLYGDGAKSTKLLTMCNIWVNRNDILSSDHFNNAFLVKADGTTNREIYQECKEAQKRRDELDI